METKVNLLKTENLQSFHCDIEGTKFIYLSWKVESGEFFRCLHMTEKISVASSASLAYLCTHPALFFFFLSLAATKAREPLWSSFWGTRRKCAARKISIFKKAFQFSAIFYLSDESAEEKMADDIEVEGHICLLMRSFSASRMYNNTPICYREKSKRTERKSYRTLIPVEEDLWNAVQNESVPFLGQQIWLMYESARKEGY